MGTGALFAIGFLIVVILAARWLTRGETHHEIVPFTEDDAMRDVQEALRELDELPESGERCIRLYSLVRHSPHCSEVAYRGVLSILDRHQVDHLELLARDLGSIYEQQDPVGEISPQNEQAIQSEIRAQRQP